MRDHVRRVAGREDEQAWIQPLEIPTGQGQVGGGGTQRRKRKGSQSRGSIARGREWSAVSIASKMRTEERPSDLAALRSSVTFVGAVSVE